MAVEASLRRLGELSEIPGISGQEGAVRDYIRERVAPLADRVHADALGNLLAFRGEGRDGRRVMLAAHMDEVGLMVSHIEENGLIRFKKVGGIDDRVLPAKAVVVGSRRVSGVIGVKPRHLQTASDRDRALPSDDMYVDIGASDRRETERLTAPGEPITFATRFGDFGEGLVKGKAFDDRAGCAVLMGVLEKAGPGPVCGAFTVQEEIGLRGARVASFAAEPQFALVLKGTPAADTPREEGESPSTELGRGPAISFMDGSSIADPGLVRTIRRVAEREGIPWQWRRTQGGGNDAGAIHLSREGVRVASISVPCRYIHTPCAVLDPRDLAHAIRLTVAVVAELSAHGADDA